MSFAFRTSHPNLSLLRRKFRRPFPLFALALVLLGPSGCAMLGPADKIDFRANRGIPEGVVQEAKKRPQETDKNRLELYQDGYVYLGWLEVQLLQDRAEKGDSLERLIQEAKRRGASLVQIIKRDETTSTYKTVRTSDVIYSPTLGRQIIPTGTQPHRDDWYVSTGLLWKKAPRLAKAWLNNHPLSIAIYQNDPEGVLDALRRGIDPGKSKILGQNAFLYACEQGYTEIVRILLEHGIDYNAYIIKDPYFSSPLFEAISGRHIGTLKTLVAFGALQKENHLRLGHLIKAIRQGSPEMVKALLEGGVNPNGQPEGHVSPLMVAAKKGDMRLVTILLKVGADPNYRLNLKANHKWCCSAVDVALAAKHQDVVSLLERNGAQPSPQKVRYLKAKIERVPPDHPLLTAAKAGNHGKVKQLLEGGHSPNSQDPDGLTPLYLAADKGHLRIARLLLDKGALIDRAPPGLGTPLVAAAISNEVERPELVRMLIEKGAYVNAKGVLAQTALHGEAEEPHVGNMRLLIEKGANVNAVTSLYRRSPIFTAISPKGAEAVTLLIENGASLTVTDTHGLTPLAYARKANYQGELNEVIAILEKFGAKE